MKLTPKVCMCDVDKAKFVIFLNTVLIFIDFLPKLQLLLLLKLLLNSVSVIENCTCFKNSLISDSSLLNSQSFFNCSKSTSNNLQTNLYILKI
jgi:hypothetical protein